MATNVSYPGVYIEEVPSGVRTIAGVPTSVAAFVGYTARGPVNTPVQIFSFADFERQFGGLSLDSDLSYAVSHFFLNGGGVAWIVRAAKGAAKASVGLRNGSGIVLTASAISEGAWGNGLVLTVDYETSSPASLFNLNVAEIQEKNGLRQVVRSEAHRNLSMNSLSGNFAADVVNSTSNLIRLAAGPTAVAAGAKGTADSVPITAAKLAQLGDNARRLAISTDGGPTYEFDFLPAGPYTPSGTFATDVTDIAGKIKTAVLALDPSFAGFDCTPTVTGTTAVLTAKSGAGGEKSSVSITSASQRNAAVILGFGPSNGGRESAAAATIRPLPSGNVWPRQTQPFDFTSLENSAALKVDLVGPGGTIGTNTTFPLWAAAAGRPANMDALRAMIETALNLDPRAEFKTARVMVVDDQMVVVPGGDTPSLSFNFTQGPKFGAGPTDMSAGAGLVKNIAGYQAGIGPTFLGQSAGTPGDDGDVPTVVELQGSQAAKTGLYALEDVDLFNILNLPNQSDPTLLAAAIAYAEERRSFVLIDLPGTVDTLPEATAWLAANGGLRHKNAAAYFPRVGVGDSLRGNRVVSRPNSGLVAGLYARTDGERGVWKAPAGTEAVLRGVRGVDYALTDRENGVINPLGLNAVRLSDAFGPIAWGARTLVGSDALASEWKYVPVRRLALFLEESLYRGTQWVVFEPNDEPLWSQIRLNVGAFMHTLFRQGAFQGKTPKEAYLVQCDSTTTTQDDINLGIVNIIVGFAPLKPAEFVIIKLQQLAGQAGAGA